MAHTPSPSTPEAEGPKFKVILGSSIIFEPSMCEPGHLTKPAHRCDPYAVTVKTRCGTQSGSYGHLALNCPGTKEHRSHGPERGGHLPMRPRAWRSSGRVPLPGWPQLVLLVSHTMCLLEAGACRALRGRPPNKHELWKQDQSREGAHHRSPWSVGSLILQVPVWVPTFCTCSRKCLWETPEGR